MPGTQKLMWSWPEVKSSDAKAVLQTCDVHICITNKISLLSHFVHNRYLHFSNISRITYNRCLANSCCCHVMLWNFKSSLEKVAICCTCMVCISLFFLPQDLRPLQDLRPRQDLRPLQDLRPPVLLHFLTTDGH